MVEPITLFDGAVGLNTVLDPQRLSHGTRETPNYIELAEAVNVSIDDRGLVSLRKGDQLAQAGSFHSLFCDGGDCFVIQERTSDAVIMQVNPNMTLTGIRSGLAKNRRTSFTQANNDTFYANGAQNGFIRGGVSSPWPVDTYHGPETNLSFVAAPVGNHVAFKPGGLMLIGAGPVLWINHEPFSFGMFNQRSGFVQFGSDIRMICPVAAGVFVSDSEQTWFLRGQSWFDFVQERVDTAPAIEWSLAHDRIALRDTGIDASGFGRFWASTDGVCIGLDDGSIINLTKEKINYPKGYNEGACLITNSHIIHTTY
jgi:hypothetical protein